MECLNCGYNKEKNLQTQGVFVFCKNCLKNKASECEAIYSGKRKEIAKEVNFEDEELTGETITIVSLPQSREEQLSLQEEEEFFQSPERKKEINEYKEIPQKEILARFDFREETRIALGRIASKLGLETDKFLEIIILTADKTLDFFEEFAKK